MVGVTATCVPTYQGLSAADLLRGTPASTTTRFPLDVPRRLSFYRARNAIYHLFRELVRLNPRLTVLAPDYNSGNEVLAMRAAGAHIDYYPINRRMQLDVETLRELCDRHRPDVVYVIHYVGWPQPVSQIADLCRSRGLFLVEDCALSLLSDLDGQPLGSFGDWSVFCLYKTLPMPNGALLIENGPGLDGLAGLRLRDAGFASEMARTAELIVQRIRGRVGGASAVLQTGKRSLGRLASAMGVRRANVGDIGFDVNEVDLAMSPLSVRLLDRFDIQSIRERRIDNYRALDAMLDPSVARVFRYLPEGTCPLFFPIFVRDKHAAAGTLHRRGVDALEFWNESSESGTEMSDDARFLRAHVLELPIHQDLTARQISYMAKHVSEVVGRGAVQ